MIEIVPSILAADFCRLGEDIRSVRPGTDMLHFDVMDGVFVPNISFGLPVLRSVRAFTDMTLDVHLMIREPARYIEAFARAGADMISVHLEADGPEGIARALDEMARCGVKRALALRPGTGAEAAAPYAEMLDMVLVMTVEPGFGGQSLIEGQLETARQVRSMLDRCNPACRLEVDGGVTAENAGRVIAAGVDVLVAGSAVFGKKDRLGAIKALRAGN